MRICICMHARAAEGSANQERQHAATVQGPSLQKRKLQPMVHTLWDWRLHGRLDRLTEFLRTVCFTSLNHSSKTQFHRTTKGQRGSAWSGLEMMGLHEQLDFQHRNERESFASHMVHIVSGAGRHLAGQDFQNPPGGQPQPPQIRSPFLVALHCPHTQTQTHTRTRTHVRARGSC
jgi:hypothetical protein